MKILFMLLAVFSFFILVGIGAVIIFIFLELSKHD